MLWLDHKLFGNGHGYKSPGWDEKFYWLSGKLYTFMPGFGAQLTSCEWFTPKPGEVRRLAGRDYRPFNTTRCGPRVRVSWATKLPDDINEANKLLREIEDSLGRNF
jgi:hypothetical protein